MRLGKKILAAATAHRFRRLLLRCEREQKFSATRNDLLLVELVEDLFAVLAALDQSGFAPFGKVVSGMNVVDSLNAEYGEGAPRGRGPDQGRLQSEGNAYLTKEFSRMDYIKKATIER